MSITNTSKTHTSSNMPSSSLGFRHGGENVPPIRRAPSVEAALPPPSLASRLTASIQLDFLPKISAPSGFLAVMFYSLFAGLLPMLLHFMGDDIDYADNVTRGVTIGLVTLLPAFILLANDCYTWFNMALFVHLANEINLLEHTLSYATASSTPDADMIWSWVGAGVVIVHLLPFFLLDSSRLNVFLAAVGIPVNLTIELFLNDKTSFMPMATFSAVSFLFVALFVTVCDCANKTSLLNHLIRVLRSGEGWIKW
jgi:uncharacterized membrane protein (DUF485 family)